MAVQLQRAVGDDMRTPALLCQGDQEALTRMYSAFCSLSYPSTCLEVRQPPFYRYHTTHVITFIL